MGVDFWWLDWQQGSNSKVEGLDPLWMLNHYHFLDSGRDGKRPMTFSRYAGPGSHRYPVGFSGDTYTTWESLDFQPYFTNTASNIGYGWWSHDIGGHMDGYKNDEMTVRWLQYGVFSPVNRMHSTKDPFYGKEPWHFEGEERNTIGRFLRLRHELLPYLYTMNARAYREDLPLIWPMYYSHPEEPAAYQVPNQYWFGSELLTAPITAPGRKDLHAGTVTAWLPEGIYIDVFTHMIYRGGRKMDLYRDLHSIPVLAKAGAIVPMTREIFGRDALVNPQSLLLKVYAGADGNFTLYEDDNETMDYQKDVCVSTEFRWNWEEKTFVIAPARGEVSLIPSFRDYTVEICGCTRVDVWLYRNGVEEAAEVSYQEDTQTLCAVVGNVAGTDEICLKFGSEMKLAENDRKGRIFRFLHRAEIGYPLKRAIYGLVCRCEDVSIVLAELGTMELDADLFGCLREILTA